MNYSEIFLKSLVKRATKKCNLFCKISAKRVETMLHVLPPTKKTLQPYLLQDRFERRWSNAKHLGSILAAGHRTLYKNSNRI